MITVTTQLRIQRERAGRKRLAKSRAAEAAVGDQVPRVSRLMALAIKFQGMLRDGIVRDQSELARLARVSQPRMTQILNLNFLAPDIQEAILFLPTVEGGGDPINERHLREVVAVLDWRKQRSAWRWPTGSTS